MYLPMHHNPFLELTQGAAVGHTGPTVPNINKSYGNTTELCPQVSVSPYPCKR